MMWNKGYTLIEILIALMVFAILATMTSSAMYHVSTTRHRINEQSDRLARLQMTMSLISKEIRQAVDRPITGSNMRQTPAFIGNTKYTEFTRGGLVNPGGHFKTSTLKRVGLVCKDDKLYRRTWAALDFTKKEEYQDKLLLDHLKACHFKYMNHDLQMLDEWRSAAVKADQKMEPLPKAIQLNLDLQIAGYASLLFTLSEALYND